MKTKQGKTETARRSRGNVNDFPPSHYSFPREEAKKRAPFPLKTYRKKNETRSRKEEKEEVAQDDISRIRPRQF